MYRTGGIIAFVVGMALTYSLVFTTFDKPIDRYVFNERGGLEQVSISCPTPWGLIVGDAESQVEHPNEARSCVRAARVLFIEGVIAFSLAIGLGIWGVASGRKPRPKSMRVLPSAGKKIGEEDS